MDFARMRTRHLPYYISAVIPWGMGGYFYHIGITILVL
jgi:hypothetical protein